MRVAALIVLALALAPSWARADGDAPQSACAALAAVLAEARRTGAIERVLGEHPFVMTRTALDPQGQPLRSVRLALLYRVSLGPAGPGDGAAGDVLRLEVRARAEPGATGDFEVEYVLGAADGRLRIMTSMLAQARTVRVVDGHVRVDGRDVGAWDDAFVPRLVAAFVLPALADQGLALPYVFRDVTAGGDLTAPRTLRALDGEGEPRFAIEDGRPEPSSVVEVTDGRVVRTRTALTVDAAGRPTLVADSVRVAPDEHARLLAAWAPAAAEPGAAVLARVLAEARRSGAISRVLGVHPFLFTRTLLDAQGGKTQPTIRMLMTYDLSLASSVADAEPDLLRVNVRVRVQGGGKIEIDYDVALADGRLRTFRADAGGGLNRAWIEDGHLVLERTGEREARPWDDVILPKIVAAFVLPMLADQGLPARVAFRDVTPFGDLTATKTLRVLPDVEGATVTTFVTDEGRPEPTSTIEVERDTHLLTRLRTIAEVDEGGHPRNVALSERLAQDAYDRLRREWFSE